MKKIAVLIGLLLVIAAAVALTGGDEAATSDKTPTLTKKKAKNSGSAATAKKTAEPAQDPSKADPAKPAASDTSEKPIPIPADRIGRRDDRPEPLVGIDMLDLNDADRDRLGVPKKWKGGVVVTRVDPRSSAAEAAIKPQDVLVQAHTTKVTNIQELEEVVGDREHTMMVVVREGHAFNVVLHKPWRGGKIKNIKDTPPPTMFKKPKHDH